MCGRFTLRTPMNRLVEAFGLPAEVDWEPRFNLAPTQRVLVLRELQPGDATTRDGLGCTELKWGLIPFWTKDPQQGRPLINARGETVAEKPSFRRSFRERRCVVIGDGYYEWKATDNGKQPYYIHCRDDGPFAMAGLWDRCTSGNEPLETCTILTTEANELTRPIHDRMPVILAGGDWERWLTSRDADELQGLIRPAESERFETYPVSREVNSPRNDRPSCLDRQDGSDL